MKEYCEANGLSKEAMKEDDAYHKFLKFYRKKKEAIVDDD